MASLKEKAEELKSGLSLQSSFGFLEKLMNKIENYHFPKNPYTTKNGLLKKICASHLRFFKSLDKNYNNVNYYYRDVFVNLNDVCEEMFDEINSGKPNTVFSNVFDILDTIGKTKRNNQKQKLLEEFLLLRSKFNYVLRCFNNCNKKIKPVYSELFLVYWLKLKPKKRTKSEKAKLKKLINSKIKPELERIVELIYDDQIVDSFIYPNYKLKYDNILLKLKTLHNHFPDNKVKVNNFIKNLEQLCILFMRKSKKSFYNDGLLNLFSIQRQFVEKKNYKRLADSIIVQSYAIEDSYFLVKRILNTIDYFSESLALNIVRKNKKM